ncbi:GAF domain-containing protein [Nocardiopsis mangrovi]|uniref:GAF domain-containing protein n=1 Tax=Nocardiopsis mangrovi TaxID=1179818 RepID=A0ABV9E360_9ACTN
MHDHDLRRLHDAVLGAGPAAPRPLPGPRAVVSASWDRSLRASVDPDRSGPPVVYSGAELRDVRSAHPLAEVVPVVRGALAGTVDASAQLLIVTDADGRILWRDGHPAVRRAADRVLLAEGTQWSENAIGTNAMGTALATQEPIQIYSAEHLVRAYHGWSCAASPIRDPDTGRLLGTLDISGLEASFHPALVGLVAAAAALAEAHLRVRMMARDAALRERYADRVRALGARPGALLSANGRVIATHRMGGPRQGVPERVDVSRAGAVRLPDGRAATLEPLSRGWLLRASGEGRPARTAVGGRAPALPPAPRHTLSLLFLGRERPVVTLDGEAVPLGRRACELLALLAVSPEGRTAERLAVDLYGEAGRSATVRVEMHRLRRLAGAVVRGSRPYRLAVRADADFLEVRRLLAANDVRGAAACYRGVLLPRSDAPGIRDLREELAATLRRSALELRDSELLWNLVRTDLGRDDLAMHEALVALLPRTSPRAAAARERMRALADDTG